MRALHRAQHINKMQATLWCDGSGQTWGLPWCWGTGAGKQKFVELTLVAKSIEQRCRPCCSGQGPVKYLQDAIFIRFFLRLQKVWEGGDFSFPTSFLSSWAVLWSVTCPQTAILGSEVVSPQKTWVFPILLLYGESIWNLAEWKQLKTIWSHHFPPHVKTNPLLQPAASTKNELDCVDLTLRCNFKAFSTDAFRWKNISEIRLTTIHKKKRELFAVFSSRILPSALPCGIAWKPNTEPYLGQPDINPWKGN